MGASDFGGILPSGTVTLGAGQTTSDLSISIPGGIGTVVSKTLEAQLSAAAPVEVIGSTAQETIINSSPAAGVAPVFGIELVNDASALPTQNGTSWTVDLGALKQYEAFNPGTLSLAVLNLAGNGADGLAAYIVASGDGGLPAGLSSSFANLPPGEIFDIANIAVETTSLGTHSETFTFSPFDTNVSGYSAIMPTETVTVTDTIYPLAQAILSTATIDFGEVRGGSMQQQAIGITNDGPAGAEALDASIGAITSAGAGTGAFNLLAVGQTSTAVAVGLNTTSFGGVVTGTVAVDLSSDGTDTDGLGSTPLLPQDVTVSGTIYREAAAGIALTHPILHVGDPGTDTLTVTNTDPADGYSENLIADVTSATGQISLNTTGTTGEIAAGSSNDATYDVSFSTAQAGTISEQPHAGADPPMAALNPAASTASGSSHLAAGDGAGHRHDRQLRHGRGSRGIRHAGANAKRHSLHPGLWNGGARRQRGAGRTRRGEHRVRDGRSAGRITHHQR